MHHPENISNNTENRFLWLKDERYQAVLKATKTVAFEYNPLTKEQYISPFINEMIAGKYDRRLLSVVMLEDNVIHPGDVQISLDFRDKVNSGTAKKMTLRLMIPDGTYHWFKMCICPYQDNETLYYIGTITDVDIEVRNRETLRYRVEYDSLTGIYNKPTFYTDTEKWMQEKRDIFRCLVRFDIDRFKIINELYSLAEGDRVLCYIAAFLKEKTIDRETYARINSDVFYICLARSAQETIAFIEELEQQLNKFPLDFQFILSAGIVTIPHYGGEPINIMCDWAAMAQRTVKGNYVSHYAFYTSILSDTLKKENHLVRSMKNAMKEGQFTVYFQPKFAINDCSIIGAEALVRWIHPKDGIISPGEFIPLFERNGFILRLDEYIWDLTCGLIRKWIDEGLSPVPISVNVSRIHMHDPEICNKLTMLIQKYNLPAEFLELEITESAYTENPEILYDIMEHLQKAGFIFSMDDFGSGYSSLNALKDIPVNLVKIDMNFLRQSRRGSDVGRNILKGAIQIIKDIHLPLLAEGVETAEQAEFLSNAGCSMAQGYYYAKPMPVDDFELLLKNRKK